MGGRLSKRGREDCTYGLYSSTAVEPRTTVAGIAGSSTHFAEAAGRRIGVHGTVGLVASVRIRGNGIARGATNVHMGLMIYARDAEAFRYHVTYDISDLDALGARLQPIIWSNQQNCKTLDDTEFPAHELQLLDPGET